MRKVVDRLHLEEPLSEANEIGCLCEAVGGRYDIGSKTEEFSDEGLGFLELLDAESVLEIDDDVGIAVVSEGFVDERAGKVEMNDSDVRKVGLRIENLLLDLLLGDGGVLSVVPDGDLILTFQEVLEGILAETASDEVKEIALFKAVEDDGKDGIPLHCGVEGDDRHRVGVGTEGRIERDGVESIDSSLDTVAVVSNLGSNLSNPVGDDRNLEDVGTLHESVLVDSLLDKILEGLFSPGDVDLAVVLSFLLAKEDLILIEEQETLVALRIGLLEEAEIDLPVVVLVESDEIIGHC